ncbi:MAG: two-component sensor histidine kinase [Parcubacteria group bacterium Gr01-1014_31]|nr:MAG: two-component sensor histidine kinase [Parcubacteria group bacterium Gr01-1014_31]
MFADERVQIGYGLLLILLIPSAIIVATVATIARYSQTIDITLQRQALLVGRVFGATVWEQGIAPVTLQRRVEAVAAANADILGLQVFTPHRDGFEIIASVVPEQVGTVAASAYYTYAWQQAEREGLATDYLGEPLLGSRAGASTGDRYWLVTLPLFADVEGDGHRERVALLSLQLSSGIVDEQAAASWRSAVIGLTFTVLLTVLFLAAATRLWSYATLYRKIKEVDQMKDEFISIASHELRTPITAIRGYVSMAIDGDFGSVPEKLRTGLERINGAGKRLGDLVEDLLNVSRIEQGRLSVSFQPLDLGEVTGGVIEELRPTAVQKQLTCEYVAPTSPVKVMADPDRLKQVLFNLVGNAIKYTPKGSVTVTVSLQEHGGCVRVKDTGLGISAADQARLFTKFYRVASDQTRAISGTGLGLWITRQLVSLMRGEITLESIEGTGTQVTVVLPTPKSAAT